jgi:NTE family protein
MPARYAARAGGHGGRAPPQRQSVAQMAPALLRGPTMLGLVLTAGGARGAYQAGVLKRIAELPGMGEGPLPFQVVTGASAGAINGAMLASRSASFRDAADFLARLWAGLRVEQVFRTDAWALAGGALGLLRDMALGALLGRTVTQSLFDATPLYDLVRRQFGRRGITDAIHQGRRGHPVWKKSRRVVLPVEISADHVCASAAIPIVFPPVRIGSAAGNL